jgi:hypothetical protein
MYKNNEKPYFQNYNHGYSYHGSDHYKHDRGFVKVDYYMDGKDYKTMTTAFTGAAKTTKRTAPSTAKTTEWGKFCYYKHCQTAPTISFLKCAGSTPMFSGKDVMLGTRLSMCENMTVRWIF